MSLKTNGVTLRVREDMGQVPLEIPLNEAVTEIAVSFDPNSRGVDLTLASGAEVSVSVPAAKTPRRACGQCHGTGWKPGTPHDHVNNVCERCNGNGWEPSIIKEALKFKTEGRTVTFGKSEPQNCQKAVTVNGVSCDSCTDKRLRRSRRGTGRTTRMINQALEWAALGQEVLIIVSYADQVSWVQSAVQTLAVDSEVLRRVTVRSLGWAMTNIGDTMRGRRQNTMTVAFDHYCDEVEPVNTENVRQQIVHAARGVRILEVIR